MPERPLRPCCMVALAGRSPDASPVVCTRCGAALVVRDGAWRNEVQAEDDVRPEPVRVDDPAVVAALRWPVDDTPVAPMFASTLRRDPAVKRAAPKRRAADA